MMPPLLLLGLLCASATAVAPPARYATLLQAHQRQAVELRREGRGVRGLGGISNDCSGSCRRTYLSTAMAILFENGNASALALANAAIINATAKFHAIDVQSHGTALTLEQSLLSRTFALYRAAASGSSPARSGASPLAEKSPRSTTGTTCPAGRRAAA